MDPHRGLLSQKLLLGIAFAPRREFVPARAVVIFARRQRSRPGLPLCRIKAQVPGYLTQPYFQRCLAPVVIDFPQRPEECLLSDLLSQVRIIINGQCEDKGLRFVCNLAEPLDEYFTGDDLKLKQVFINILGNSVNSPIRPV